MTPLNNFNSNTLSALVTLADQQEFDILLKVLEYLKQDIMNSVLVPQGSEQDLARLNQARGFHVALQTLQNLKEDAKATLEAKSAKQEAPFTREFPHPNNLINFPNKV